MESNYSSLREVLNNIASIQHELANDQTQMLDSDILMQLKSLAARLYLESDIELLSKSFVDDEIAVVEQAPEIVPNFIPEVDQVADAAVVESVSEEVTEMVVEIAVAVPEASVTEVVTEEVIEVVSEAVDEIAAAVPEASVADLVVEEAIVSEVTVPEAVSISSDAVTVVDVATPEPKVVASDLPSVEVPVSGGLTVESVIGQMPLSRRFEFSNILFGGNMEKMGMFIQQIIDAPNAAGRLDVYDRWYEECQWRRRDESASDMLRMIKRIFAS